MALFRRVQHPPERARKFRLAAIAYLHYAVLYLAGARALVEQGHFPAHRGPVWFWFALGTTIAAAVIWALWWWQEPWFARVFWFLPGLRLPTLIEGAFLGGGEEIAPGLYLAAGIVVIATMWMLARAAWDV